MDTHELMLDRAQRQKPADQARTGGTGHEDRAQRRLVLCRDHRLSAWVLHSFVEALLAAS